LYGFVFQQFIVLQGKLKRVTAMIDTGNNQRAESVSGKKDD